MLTEINNYHFNIKLSDVNFMVKNTIQKIRKTKIQFIISCDFIPIFETKISFYEDINVLLTKDTYVINIQTKRKNTVFLRINSRCKNCKIDKKVKYIMTIQKKPTGSEKTVKVECKKIGNHAH